MTDVRFTEFTDYLARVPLDERQAVLTRAEMVAANQTADAAFDAAPALLSAEGLALRSAERISRAEQIIASTQQYADHPERLAEDDQNAVAARTHVAHALVADDEHGLTLAEADGIVSQAVRRYGGWRSRRTDLGSMMRDGVPPRVTLRGRTGLADQLVVRGQWGDFKGHPESMKSLVGLAVGYDYMLNGGRFVYLDWENGDEEVTTRLIAVAKGFAEHLGAVPPDGMTPEELISGRMVYEYAAGSEPNWADCREIAAEYPDAFWLWDSARGIIRSYGGDENSAKDVGHFVDPLDEFTKREPVGSTVMLDHVTKDATSSMKYSRGSGDKLGGAQFGWYFDVNTVADLHTVGNLTARRTKGRSAVLTGVVGITLGDGAGLLPVTAGGASGDQAEATRRDAILRFLKANHPADASVEQMYTAKASGGGRVISGAKDRIRATADNLADDVGVAVIRTTVERRGASCDVYAFDPSAPQPLEP